MIWDLILFDKKKAVRSFLLLVPAWLFIFFFLFHATRGFLWWMPKMPIGEATPYAVAIAIFAMLGVYVFPRGYFNKLLAITYIDKKFSVSNSIAEKKRKTKKTDLTSFYTDISLMQGVHVLTDCTAFLECRELGNSLK
jgi:hypothetical protein